MDRDYEIKKIPGTSRSGLYMGGFLLARIERGMEREMDYLRRVAELNYATAMNDVMTRPLKMVVPPEKAAEVSRKIPSYQIDIPRQSLFSKDEQRANEDG